MLSRKKLKTESVKRAVKKAKHQPRHLRAAAQNMALRLSMLAVLGIIIFSCVFIYKDYKNKTQKAAEKAEQANKETTSEEKTENTKQWYEHRAIAHALGEIDGKEYTNSKDAFFKLLSEGL